VTEDGRFDRAADLAFDAEGNAIAVDAADFEAEKRF
jgi:hypothetical protein